MKPSTFHIILYLILFPLGLSAQVNSPFPSAFEKLYFQEEYAAIIGPGLRFLDSVAITNSPTSYQLIRIAYYISWSGYLEEKKDSLVQLWKNELAANLSSVPNDPIEQSDYLTITAVEASGNGDQRKAIQFLKSALKIRPLTTKIDTAIQADGYQFLGSLLKKQMDYKASMESYREAIRLNQLIQREEAVPLILLEKTASNLYTDRSNPQILADLKIALNYFRKDPKNPNLSFAYNEIGNYWTVQKNYPEAAKWFLASEEVKKNQNRNDIHLTYNNLSATYNLMHRPDSVLFYMRLAIKVTPEHEFENKALYYSNLGAIYGGLNQPDSALHCFTQALQTLFPTESFEDISFNPNPAVFIPILPTVLANKGNALYELGTQQNNAEYVQLALKSLGVAVDQFNTIRTVSSLDDKHLFVSNSREYYFLALEAAAALNGMSPSQTNHDLLIKYGQQAKSAVFNEYQRIQLARDSLNLDPAIIAADDSLKSLKAKISQKLFLAERNNLDTPEEIAGINADVIRISRELEDLSNKIEEDYPYYSKYIKTPRITTLQSIQENLSDDEFLIDYTYSDSTLIIVGIGQEELLVVKSYLPADFILHVNNFMKLFGSKTGGSFSEFTHLAYEFYELLILPIRDHIAEKSLIVIPDGIIGYLPFDTFISDSSIPSRKHYNELPLLIKKHAIRYLSSIDQLVATPVNERTSPLVVEAFAPFNKSPYLQDQTNLPVLKGSEQEIKGIAKYVRVNSHLNDKALKSVFLSRINQPQITHLATHGLLSSGNPMNNRILFSQQSEDPNLPLFEVINISIKSQLVVLSACETGSGDLQEGEGIMSLTRGFHSAGAHSLIMSLWPAYDKPSVKIMEVFYRNLGKGKSLSKSIQAAKLEYLDKANSSNSRPGLWANYQLSGSDLVVKLKKPWRHYILYLMPILFLLALIPVIRYRKRKS